MSSCSLLAQVQSLNHEIRQENDKMYSLLQSLLHEDRISARKSFTASQQEGHKHREEAKRHNNSHSLILKKKKSASTVWPSVELRTVHSKSTKRCESCCKISRRQHQNRNRPNKSVASLTAMRSVQHPSPAVKESNRADSTVSTHNKLKKLSVRMFELPKFNRCATAVKPRLPRSMLRL